MNNLEMVDVAALFRLATEGDLVSTRDKVLALETEMKKQPQVDIHTEHYFSQGVYAREIYIPKGTLLTGQIHKYSQLNILLQGEISVLVDDEIKRIKAPFRIVSPPGTKRIAYVHEDTIWMTVHGTDERDLEVIEKKFICHSEQEYLDFEKQLELNFKDFSDKVLPSNNSFMDH